MGILDSLTGNENVQPLPEPVARRLVEGALNKMDRVMFILVLNSGLSLDELLALRSSDVDAEKCSITIYNKTIRTVRVPASVITEIREYTNGSSEDRMLFPLSVQTVMNRLKSYQNSCPLKMNWRVLRRTYADLAIKKRIPPQIIANNIGVPLNVLLQSFPFYENGRSVEIPSVIG